MKQGINFKKLYLFVILHIFIAHLVLYLFAIVLHLSISNWLIN